MAMTHPASLIINKEQLWSNQKEIITEVFDSTGAPLTGNFVIVLVILCTENEVAQESMFGPGPVAMVEHPDMKMNMFNLFRS